MSANAGTTRNVCIILARNPKPTKTPAQTIQRVLAFSTARTVAYAPRTSSRTSSESGLLNRNISTATGVNAKTAPASNAAPGENQRRTVAYSTPTAATPSRACGTSMLHGLSPKMRTERSVTHSEAGGLSTVMKFDASDEPKKNAFQLVEPAWAAAE